MSHNDNTLFGRSGYGDRKIGQILLERELVTVSELSEALATQEKMKKDSKRQFKIGEILLFAEMIRLEDLQSALRSQTLRAQASRADALAAKSSDYAKRMKKERPLNDVKKKSSGFLSKLLGVFSK